MIILFIIYIYAVSACLGGPASNGDNDETHVLLWIGHVIYVHCFSPSFAISLSNTKASIKQIHESSHSLSQSHHAFFDPLANNSEFLSDSEVSQLPVSKKKSTSHINNCGGLRSLALTLFCLRGVC